MADHQPFRVIIAGGGIAGLALANALESAGIEYVLVEKKDIAPQMGASICVHCHTFKIFEQLGAWQRMSAEVFPLTARRHYRHGKLFDDSPVFERVMEAKKRPCVFMERRFCLEKLHENIKDKSRILTNTSITSFSEDEDGITVMTDGGESIRGSILVGTDGVHSKVRDLLAESISEEDPQRYQNLVGGFKSRYRTVFGTSKNGLGKDKSKPLLPNGIIHHAYYRNLSGLTTAGPNGVVFWFLFVKEESVSKTPNCPRYTEADAAATIAKYGHLIASPGYTFRDLWDARIGGGMVPMEEGVIQGPWNNGRRVVLVGDATTKTTVTGGLGGNLAVEGICNLANELVPLVRRTSAPTTKELAAIFDRYEQVQRPRAEFCLSVSTYITRYESMDSLWLRFMRLLAPWIPLQHKTKAILDYMKPAPFLNFLPDPDSHKFPKALSLKGKS
ncbi:hypothetical protein M426DRAFT_324228 [Hypoxylon sp. CI-4A]|nr:hypothetical protein M426DRAFT_324228 [Hypoxylon sp. CI-4A]